MIIAKALNSVANAAPGWKVLPAMRQTESTESKFYTNNCNVLKGWIARDIGETLLSIDEDHISDAEAWAKKAIEADRKNEVRWSLARDYTLYAEVFKRKGDQSKAKENLTKALDIYKQCGADGWVKKYEEDSASLS